MILTNIPMVDKCKNEEYNECTIKYTSHKNPKASTVTVSQFDQKP